VDLDARAYRGTGFLMKKPYSFSLDDELILLTKKYYFINWSNVINTYLKKHMKKNRSQLEELLKDHIKLMESEI